MYKEYKTKLITIIILFGLMFGWNHHEKQIEVSSNEKDINMNQTIEGDDFEFVFNEPIYYPDEDLLYFQFNESLTNPLYINGANTFKVFDGDDNEIFSQDIKEGINYYSVENATKLVDGNKYFRLAVYNGKELVIDALKMSSNIVRYEDLSDYAEEGKSKKEMRREVKYFIYQYENDPLLNVDDLPKTDTETEFKGSVKDQHEKLCEILDNMEYDSNSQDKVIEYFKSEIPKGEYDKYSKSEVISEKQINYNQIMNDVEYNLSVEILDLENELQNAGYVNYEDLKDLEAGLNVLEQRNVLQKKLDDYSKVEVGTHKDSN